MVCTKSLARILVFVCVYTLCWANTENGDINASAAKENDQERYKAFGSQIRSFMDSPNEIDDDIDKKSSGGRILPPDVFQSEDQCDYMKIQRMHTQCVCNKPRKQCVRINNPHGAVMSTMPECVIVERCEGICPYSESCLPKVMESISVPIIVFSLVPGSGNSVKVEPLCKTIQVEKHVKCGCACGITEKDCFPGQTFNPVLCRCECPNPRKADNCRKQNKSWDPLSCECVCPSNIPQTCSTGAFFHSTQCKCVPNESEKAWKLLKRRGPPFRPNLG